MRYERPEGEPQLLGTHEASLLLGVEKAQISLWLRQGYMLPEPAERLKAGPIWLRSQLDDALADLYRERTGRQDEHGMREWARERALREARRRGIDPEEVERLFETEETCSHRVAGSAKAPRHAVEEDLGEQLRRRVSSVAALRAPSTEQLNVVIAVCPDVMNGGTTVGEGITSIWFVASKLAAPITFPTP